MPGGQGLGSERRIILYSPNPAPDAIQLFRFNLAGHPEWRGQILRLRLAVPPLLRVVLHDMQGFSETLLTEQ